MNFRILGDLEVWADGTRLPLGGVRDRTVLGVLLLDAGQVVPVARLVDAVWPDDPPATAVRQVQNAVSRLRQLLKGPGLRSPGLLETADGGYRLTARGEEIDAWVFEAKVAEAAQAAAAVQPALAAGILGDALGLWRGRVLEGLGGAVIDSAATAWDQRRRAAQDTYYQHMLMLGRHRSIVPELSSLLGEDPFREATAAQLMLALYRCGNQAGALMVYQATRDRLCDDLGVDPGPELNEIHRQILNHAAELEPPAGGFGDVPAVILGSAVGMDVPSAHREWPAAPPVPVPRQLPAALRDFAGRKEELKRLDDLLGNAGTMVITAISGTAGVGKTALAVHWAHAIAGQFPDGQLYVNMRGFNPDAAPMEPGEALRRVLDSLGVPPGRIPAEPDAAAALYRSMVAGKRMLVVLDNVRDAGRARLLLPGSGGCLVIVTSRDQLSGLVAGEDASLLTLDVLTEREARDMLTARLGSDRIAAEPRAVTELITLCARLPLALAITSARAAAHPGLRLSHLVNELADASSRLDALDAGDIAASVRSVLSWSYQNLDGTAARMFRLLGLHPGPDVSVAAAASLAAVPLAEARGTLRELTRANLLNEPAPGRHAFHDLLRVYATEQAAAYDGAPGCGEAVHRVLDHYVFTAQAAATRLNPTRPQLAGSSPCRGVLTEPIGDVRQALAWFRTEHRVLLAAITLAGHRPDPRGWQLAWTMGPYLCRSGHWQDWADSSQAALQAAQHLGDLTGAASAQHGLGLASQFLGFSDQARDNLLTAASLFRDCGEITGEARAYFDLAYVTLGTSDLAQAARYLRRAEELYRAAGHQAGQAVALTGLGWILARAGSPEDAIPPCQQALSLHRESGYSTGEAYTWHSLGLAQHQLGRYHEALASHRHTAQLCQDAGERYYAAMALTGCGDAHHALGDHGAASDAWHQALAILDELQHTDAGQLRDRLAAQPQATHATAILR
jgi:DNA-binding SARP family transcriptional activator/tetratricopeptide (TPR) repeat protein